RRPQGGDDVVQGEAQAQIRPALVPSMDAAEVPGDDVRQMLRDSLRGFLGEQWTADCVRRGPSPPDVAAIWSKLVGQGIATLGCNLDEGGLREIAVVLAELGRAACPAPMWSAAIVNFALSTVQS